MALGILLDIVILVILFFGLLFGYRKGFFIIAVNPFRFIISLSISISLCGIVANAIIAPRVYDYLYNRFCSTEAIEDDAKPSDDIPVEIPVISQIALSLLDDFSKDAGNKNEKNVISEAIKSIAKLISCVISFLILMLLSKVLISGLLSLINLLLSVGIVSLINRWFGVILGGFLAFVFASILVNLTDAVFNTESLNSFNGGEEFRSGMLYKMLLKYNFFNSF